ncbi:MAG TPA: hypothetical protein VLC79_06965 [Cellvibrio sp.]|nr:hypothetical protein [Cellvibrio sp.]
MRNVIILILIALAYIAGYVTPKTAANSAITAVPVESASVKIQASEAPAKTESLAATAKNSVINSGQETAVEAKTKPSSVTGPESVATTQPPAAPVIADSPSTATAQRPLTNEQIDKLLPVPFNQYLKGHDATMLGKYRKFSEQEYPSRQDTDIQNKIADSIASNPYSKFLTIESLQCKASLCEIRLYENKLGVWSYIQSEMRLQDWWKFHSSSAQGFGVGKENVNGWYVLLTP